jgi:hypothetical protein
MLDVATPSRAGSHTGFGVCQEKKGPHPAKETAPEIGNLLTRGNHRQIPAPSGKRLAQKGFGSMNLEIDGHTDLAVLGDFHSVHQSVDESLGQPLISQSNF